MPGIFSLLSSGSWIVFCAQMNGNWDLFRVRAGGDRLERLTETLLDERSPALSPDGKKIAYSDSGGRIWVLSLADRSTSLLQLPDGNYDQPAWQGDQRLAVVRSWATATVDDSAIGVVDLIKGGSSYRDEIDLSGAQDYLAMHPSMARAAFANLERLENGFQFRILLWDWAARMAERIVEMDNAPVDLDWSPDGKTIAFVCEDDRHSAIWMLRHDEDSPTVFFSASEGVRSPRWSPDGSALVATRGAGLASRLTIISFPSGESRELQPFPSDVPCRDPDWGLK